MPTLEPGTLLHSFVDSIRRAASEVLSRALSTSWSAEIGTDDSTEASDTSHLCFALSLSGSLQGNAAVQIRKDDALLLAQKFLAEPVEPSAELDTRRKEAVGEFLRQVAGVAAAAMRSQFGELKLEVGITGAPSSPGDGVVLLVGEASAGKLPLVLRLSAELLASLSSLANPKVDDTRTKQEAAADDGAGSLERLLGVNLNLSLRFGRRSLTLRELLDLNSGSVVELDRQVEEPVELLLGEKLIARGEVIIVDGNYGVRITEVPGA